MLTTFPVIADQHDLMKLLRVSDFIEHVQVIPATEWHKHLSHIMRKPYAKTKSIAVTAKLISAFVFTTWIVQYLYFLNSNFPASSIFSTCTAQFVSDLVRNHIVGFLMMRLISSFALNKDSDQLGHLLSLHIK